MRILQALLLSFALSFCIEVKAQTSQKFLDSLYGEIAFLIGDSWYLEKTDNGFQVTYCKSCKNAYNQYLDTTDYFSRNLTREDFFKNELIDSVSYYSSVSNPPIPWDLNKDQRIAYFSKFYEANAILRFNVIFEKKWTQDQFNAVLARNNQLKDSILLQPMYKTNMGIFSDYRFWLPEENLRSRTQGLDFYFERLPYESLTLDKSIFMLHNKPFYFAKTFLVDKNDQEYCLKQENHLEDERSRTLKIIALALGIHDFVIVN